MSYLDLALGALEGQPDPREKRVKRGKVRDSALTALNAPTLSARCPDCARFVQGHGGPGVADSFCPACPGWEGFWHRIIPPHVMEEVRREREAYRRLGARAARRAGGK